MSEETANLKSTDAKVLKAVERILALQKKRKNINDSIAEEKSQMETLGVDKKALMQRIAMMKMDAEQRAAFDTSADYLAHLFEGEVTLFTPDPSDSKPRSDPKRGGAEKAKKPKKTKATPASGGGAETKGRPTEAELTKAAANAQNHDPLVDEQSEGASVLDSLMPDTSEKMSQSEISRKKLEEAKMLGVMPR